MEQKIEEVEEKETNVGQNANKRETKYKHVTTNENLQERNKKNIDFVYFRKGEKLNKKLRFLQGQQHKRTREQIGGEKKGKIKRDEYQQNIYIRK